MNPRGDRRSIRYIDVQLQRWLMLALVLLELLILVVGVGYLYFGFNAILEARLYSIHLPEGGGVQPEILLIIKVVGAMFLVNIVALVIADQLWRRQVNGVLMGFRESSRRIGGLDFRDTGSAGHHELTILTQQWREQERAHWLRLEAEIVSLDSSDGARVSGALLRLKQQIAARHGGRG